MRGIVEACFVNCISHHLILFYKQGKESKKIKYLAKIIQLEPDPHPVLFQLSDWQLKSGLGLDSQNADKRSQRMEIKGRLSFTEYIQNGWYMIN